MTYHDIQNKDIAIPRSKHRIKDFDLDSDPNRNLADLTDRLDALQRAVANERGINERFRQEILAKVRLLLERGPY
jgi:hypothetical protein